MADPRTQQAIERIERALARIEASAALPVSDTAASQAVSPALRNKVEGALRDLDALIAELEA